MIQQIFNLYSNIFKLIRFNNSLLFLFIGILIVLYNYGYITVGRIIIFSVIIIWICIYKFICKRIQKSDFNYNANKLYVLLCLDYLKLFLINILISVSIKTYEIKTSYKNNFIIDYLILIFDNLTINPLKKLLNKFYNILNVWKTTPILELFFKRIYGSLLGILIFSNIISYVWYLMNYSIFNVYVMLLIINLIDELVKSQKFIEYKIFSYLEYIKYLNLNKNLFKIIELRRSSSIFSLYIQKLLQKVNFNLEQSNRIKSFAFIINNIYYLKQSYNIKILNFKIKLSEYKFYQSEDLFKSFYFEIVLCLNYYLRLLVTVDYVLIKKTTDLEFDKNNLLKLKTFMLLVVKMLLYYLWDFENIGKDLQNSNFSNLIISQISTIYELEYIATYNAVLLNNRIFDIQNNSKFYDEFYLYAKIVSSYDLNNNIVIPSEILNFGNYKNIECYSIDLINQLLKINAIYGIDIEFCRANEIDSAIELKILEKLNAYKQLFVEEWRNSKTLDVEKANLQRLNTLNDYINSHFSEIQNIKRKK